MKEKEVIVDEKKFIVKELKAKVLDDINWDDKKAALKTQVQLSTELSDAEYDELSIRERIAIVKTINEINGFSEAN